ncbi:hypothetical protein [Lysobacter enzymogenes]|uniref:hypothetical protein n=1 Tax=Lysobacter enzymogenes TaxID=69 RepID=UPI001A96773F|nr:hypothetical protein [Lysobacter enzymogenes]QQP96527.1 hypothetical protein JHW38_00265 [Lysobacter enzymogenes]
MDKRIDATLMVTKSGACWYDPHWMAVQGIEDPSPSYHVVEIRDATGEIPPAFAFVLPDRSGA